MKAGELVENWPKKFSFLELTRQLDDQTIEPKQVKASGVCLTLHASGILEAVPDNLSESVAVKTNDLDLVISCGIHGNETAPIEVVDQLVSDIVNGTLAVNNRVLFIIGNPMAINAEARFVEENMNRLFCGAHQGKSHKEAKRARLLEHHLSQFFSSEKGRERRHYDLHTAIRASKYEQFVVYPYSSDHDWDREQIAFFGASGISTVLLGHKPSTTFSYFSRQHFSAHGFTVELGQVKPFGENDLSKLDAIKSNIKALIAGANVKIKPFNNDDYQLFAVKAELLRRSENFKLNVDDDVANFSEFEPGFQLTEDIDGGYQVEHSGEAIVFPNSKVPIGQRAGLVVEKTIFNEDIEYTKGR